MAKKHSATIMELARKGAAHRYEELKKELTALLKAFPHLEYGSAISPAMPRQRFVPAPRKRRPMSSAAKKAASLRMKKYWEKRKAAKG